jgi:hypothetical protein
MIRAWHEALMGEERVVYRFFVGKLDGKRPLGRSRRRIILVWIFSKWDVGVWNGLGWLRLETVGGQL